MPDFAYLEKQFQMSYNEPYSYQKIKEFTYEKGLSVRIGKVLYCYVNKTNWYPFGNGCVHSSTHCGNCIKINWNEL
jgi:hypothetical protein